LVISLIPISLKSQFSVYLLIFKLRRRVETVFSQLSGQYTMREMEENFNKETCIDTLRLMSGNRKLKMPHYDTLNYYLERLSPECLSDLRKKMVTSLIRGKQFNRNRIQGKYWRIILDGTGLFCFKERHCANCLCTTRKMILTFTYQK